MKSICCQTIHEDSNSCCHLPVCYHILVYTTIIYPPYFTEQHIAIRISIAIAIISKTGCVNNHATRNNNTHPPTNLPIAAIPE